MLFSSISIDPSLKRVEKSSIFGYAQDKHYMTLFKNEDFNEQIEEMILAYNLFDIISQ